MAKFHRVKPGQHRLQPSHQSYPKVKNKQLINVPILSKNSGQVESLSPKHLCCSNELSLTTTMMKTPSRQSTSPISTCSKTLSVTKVEALKELTMCTDVWQGLLKLSTERQSMSNQPIISL